MGPAHRSDGRDRWTSGAHVVLAGLAYLLLAVYATWPLARRAGDHLYGIDPVRWAGAAPLGMADHYLNLWILSWVCHALRHAPGALFDANIFHPLPESLATGEHLLGAVPWYAPVFAATGNPIAAANALVFVSFVLGGLGMYLLVLGVTERRGAAFIAGVVFAFAPWRFAWLVHLQLVGVHVLPFMVLFLRRALERGRAVSVLAFGIALLLQALTSYYLAYMCAVLCAAVLLWIPRSSPGGAWRRVGAVLVAGATAAVVVGLVSRPYLRLAARGLLPSGAEAQALSWLQIASAQPAEFFVRGSPQYAGLVPVALAAIGLGHAGGGLRLRLLFLWAAASGFALSLGPMSGEHHLPYEWLARWIPGFSTMRVPERFVILATFGVAGLCGIGTARLQTLVTTRLRSRPGLRSRSTLPTVNGMLTALVLAALLLDWVPREMRLGLRRFSTLAESPPVYRWLAEHGSGLPLLEVPARRGGFVAAEAQARSQYRSVLHWLPLLGGYNGYQPPFLDLYADLARDLPAEDALQTLVNVVDVGWVLVHTDELDPVSRIAWQGDPRGLERAVELGNDVVFRVVLGPTEDWRAHLREPGPEATTFAGLPIQPVPYDGREAIIDGDVPKRRLSRRQALSIAVRVTNPTAVRWPCFAAGTEGVVRLWGTWLTADGKAVGQPASARIPRDLGAGEQADVTLVTWSPAEAGRYVLELGVGQGAPGDPAAWRAGPRRFEVEVVGAEADS